MQAPPSELPSADRPWQALSQAQQKERGPLQRAHRLVPVLYVDVLHWFHYPAE